MLRWIVRLVLLAVLGFGLLLGVVYPWGANDSGGREIGRSPAYSEDEGFLSGQVTLPSSEEQVLVVVEMTTESEVDGDGAAVMTLTVTSEGRTDIARALTLDGVQPREFSPQIATRLYRIDCGAIAPVGGGTYEFVFGPGEIDVPIISADLVLIGGTYPLDPRMPPIGYGMIAIGFVGLVLSFRRRRENPNSSPPPKWGRQV